MEQHGGSIPGMVSDRTQTDFYPVFYTKIMEHRGTIADLLRTTCRDDTLLLDQLPVSLQLKVVEFVEELLLELPTTRLQ